MQILYPNESQFNENNFGFCPIIAILKALEIARNRDLEIANLRAVPLAEIGIAMSAIGGAKNPQRDWFNPFGVAIKRQDLKKRIDKEVAEICWELFNSNQMPTWVGEQIDIEAMRIVSSDD